MDEIDLLILSELMEDARKPFSTIADNVGVSTQTVKRRYQTLKKKHILLSSIRIDTKKLGYIGVAFLLMNSLPGTGLSDVLENLKRIPGVTIVTRAFGEFEGYAELYFKNFHDLFEKIITIKKIPNLGKLEFALTKNVLNQLPYKLDTISPYKDLIKESKEP